MINLEVKEARLGNWIMTYSGEQFYLLDPRAEEVKDLDIAHALSNICRFTGHTSEFYSVAIHSILCAEQARRDKMSSKIQLYCLLHDGSEAYLGDLSRPLKAMLPDYVVMEEKVQNTVYEAFGLAPPSDEEWATVKHYDDFLLGNEITQLMMNPEDFSVTPVYDGIPIPRFGNVHVKQRFLEILDFLLEEYKEEQANG